MKMTNEPLTAPQEKSSKASLFFTALVLAALMVSAVVGGAAFLIYRQFSTMPSGAQASTGHLPATARLTPKYSTGAPQQFRADAAPMNRPVAAESSDHSDFRYADNTVLPPAAARRVIAAWRSNPVVSNVPPPLVKTPEEASDAVGNLPPEIAQATGYRPTLNDPESHYIVSPTTGRIIGVDGSAGAAAEARRQQAMSVSAAAQLPPPEIRVASPVQVRAAFPVNSGDEDSVSVQVPVAVGGYQSTPGRRTQLTASGHSFDAASYLAHEDDLRSQTHSLTSRRTR